MSELWDGEERRTLSPKAIAEQAVAAAVPHNPQPSPREILCLVIDFAILILVITSVWGHKILGDRSDNEADRAKVFRQSISCYIVEITKGPIIEDADRLDILTRCGLIGGLPLEVDR